MRSKQNSTAGKDVGAYCSLLFRGGVSLGGWQENEALRWNWIEETGKIDPLWGWGVGGGLRNKKRRQKMRPGERTQQGVWLWHHVTPARSRGCWVLRFLKGPVWCLWVKTESVWAQLGATDTEWVGRYGTAWLQPAWAEMAAYLSFSQPRGKIWNAWETRGGCRRETLSALSRGGWSNWGKE